MRRALRIERLRNEVAFAAQPLGVTHGEPVPDDSLRQAIEERHCWRCRRGLV